MQAGQQTENNEATESEQVITSSRKDEAKRIVSKHVGWSAGTGVIPLPLWDIAAVAAVQVKMVKELLDLYDRPFSESKTKNILYVLVGSLSPQMLARVTAASIFKFVPVVGHALAFFTLPMLSSAASYAVGKVMISHLENGGSLDDMKPGEVKEKFQNAFEEGKKKVKSSMT